MEPWTDISLNAWSIAMMLISLTVPVIISLFIIRVLGGSAKKTIRAIRRK